MQFTSLLCSAPAHARATRHLGLTGATLVIGVAVAVVLGACGEDGDIVLRPTRAEEPTSTSVPATKTAGLAAAPAPPSLPTPTPPQTPTRTATPTPLPSPTPAPTQTPAPTATPTPVPRASISAATPTAAPAPSATEIPSAVSTATPTTSPTNTPSAVSAATPTTSPANSPTAVPTTTPTPSPTPTSTPPPTATSEPVPTPTPEAIDETGFRLTLPDGFRISLFTPDPLGPIRFMAFSPDEILFASIPNATGLYSGDLSGGKILALPDLDQDGKADEARTVLTGFNNLPHGIGFHDGYLYVAEEHRISRYPYLMDGVVGEQEVIVENLPTEPGREDHVSRTIGFSSTGKMYISVGSSCNACVEQDLRRAAILEFNADGSNYRLFAEGLRNAVGFVFHPVTGELWATENGRDYLGDDLPPDEINTVQEGDHYGWPYCYGEQIPDPEFNRASFCGTSRPSVHDIQAHSAPLGLRFIQSAQFPAEWHGDLLVAYHGSWNRKEPTGYKVVRLEVEGDQIVGEDDFISGWLKGDRSVLGRPVDLIFDSDGALYISDDKSGLIYRVTRIQADSSGS